MIETNKKHLETVSLQTRTEHSRSLEDAEKYRALEVLKEVGLLIPLSEIETFHGRVAYANEDGDWSVDPSFANGSNDSGNYNVNERTTLYTGDEATAQSFADERAGFTQKYIAALSARIGRYTPNQNIGRLARQNAFLKELWEEDIANGYKDPKTTRPDVWTMDEMLARNSFVEAFYLQKKLGPRAFENFKEQFAHERRAEVHEIVTADTDAMVLDFGFDESSLDEEGLKKYRNALMVLALPVSEGSPVDFNDRNAVVPFVAVVNKHKKRVVLSDEIHELAAEAGVNEKVALQLAGAYNARTMGQLRPAYLVNKLINNSEDIITDSIELNGKQQELPINLEYVQKFLREAHVVGVMQKINSATLRRDIISVSFFDLEKMTTSKRLQEERQNTWHNLGGLATVLGRLSDAESQLHQPLLRLLEDVHVKPDKLVDAAKKIAGYDEIFDADAGNWEGFSLAQHTETVLRNFDENYADKVPVELLSPMRLAILAHDVGKPIAVAHGHKNKQKQYNIAQAEDFLSKIGVDDGLKSLLLAVIGDGAELAFQIQVRDAGAPAKKAMIELATKAVGELYGPENVTKDKIKSFYEMCKMLQVCDGGAYTSMAVTNRGTGKGRHRNAPSFNGSFAQPIGFGKRTIRLATPGETTAAPDLTPRVVETAPKS